VEADTNLAKLGSLAEGVWRIERRARREGAVDWIGSLIERVWDDLAELQVEVIDRTGTPYRDGESLEKLHSDAPDGWTGELVVTEVISPSIRVGGVLVQSGKVIVGASTKAGSQIEGELCPEK
jgi:hypothetical protein